MFLMVSTLDCVFTSSLNLHPRVRNKVGATLAVVCRSRTKEEEKAAKEAEKESWTTREPFVDV